MSAEQEKRLNRSEMTTAIYVAFYMDERFDNLYLCLLVGQQISKECILF